MGNISQVVFESRNSKNYQLVIKSSHLYHSKAWHLVIGLH